MAYTESYGVEDARRKKRAVEESRPEGYSSAWAERQEQAMGALLDRKEFSYDLNADALYNQYKDAYIRQGRLAMEDAAGSAAARTGGYGNSYAQTAAQQAYQGYLQELNGMVPEFYRLALDAYTREGDRLRQNYDLAREQEQLDYSRYQDYMNQWLQERNFANEAYRDQRDTDYRRYRDEQEARERQAEAEREDAYRRRRDFEKDRQWQEEMDYKWATARYY